MTTPAPDSFVANLKFSSWRGRLYLRPRTDAAGEASFREATHKIETEIGPKAKTQSEFVHNARKVFEAYGFEEFRR